MMLQDVMQSHIDCKGPVITFRWARTSFSIDFVTSKDVFILVSIINIKNVVVVGVCTLALFLSCSLSSCVFVPDRLMMIICAQPPVCAVHALIGACSPASSIKGQRERGGRRETSWCLRLFRSPSP